MMMNNDLQIELERIPEHLFDLGCSALSHALRLVCYNNMGGPKHQAELGLLQSAHAAEILIKSCIAKAAHPLLVFENFPHSNSTDSDWLTIEDLAHKGKTIQYKNLPERLWATTGYQLSDLERFRRFGELRNAIQHFGVPPSLGYYEASELSLSFLFPTIDDLMAHFWGACALEPFVEDHAPEYCVIAVAQHGLPYRTPSWMSEEERGKIDEDVSRQI